MVSVGGGADLGMRWGGGWVKQRIAVIGLRRVEVRDVIAKGGGKE